MEQQKLIFDIGMHQGEDLQFYFNQGCKVIAADADPLMIEFAKRKFKNYIDSDRLILVNKAICDVADKQVILNLSSNSAWNSIDPSIAGRSVFDSLALGISGKQASSVMQLKVQSTTLSVLIEQFGVPYYCKIDIEGMDDACLQSLKELKVKPTYISCETECIGENKKMSEEDSLRTLNSLHNLGYAKFILVDQATLQPLSLNKKFYTQKHKFLYYANRVINKLGVKVDDYSYRDALQFKFNYTFPEGASGPYGEHLQGDWYNFTQAKELLIKNRKDYFALSNAAPYGFWCDWHATD